MTMVRPCHSTIANLVSHLSVHISEAKTMWRDPEFIRSSLACDRNCCSRAEKKICFAQWTDRDLLHKIEWKRKPQMRLHRTGQHRRSGACCSWQQRPTCRVVDDGWGWVVGLDAEPLLDTEEYTTRPRPPGQWQHPHIRASPHIGAGLALFRHALEDGRE
jgi:hypothetical protein